MLFYDFMNLSNEFLNSYEKRSAYYPETLWKQEVPHERKDNIACYE